MEIKKKVAIGGGLALILNASAAFSIQDYIADYESHPWTVTTSKLSCRLIHTIPEYGKIAFMQEAGEMEKAELNVWYARSIQDERAELFFTSPGWQKKKVKAPGWKFPFGENGRPVRFSAREARTLLDRLDQGLLPTLLHTNNSNRREMVQAKISTIDFYEHYQKYTSCQAEIVPVNFETIRNSNVYFESGSTRLDEEAKRWMGYVIAYATDPAVFKIDLEGYTDSVGSFRANHKLASERLEVVRDYLVAAGISKESIKLRVYGEQKPVSLNSSEHGRSLNRRVNIKMAR